MTVRVLTCDIMIYVSNGDPAAISDNSLFAQIHVLWLNEYSFLLGVTAYLVKDTVIGGTEIHGVERSVDRLYITERRASRNRSALLHLVPS